MNKLRKFVRLANWERLAACLMVAIGIFLALCALALFQVDSAAAAGENGCTFIPEHAGSQIMRCVDWEIQVACYIHIRNDEMQCFRFGNE